MDSYGSTCQTYTQKKWCTRAGKAGTAWDSSWGALPPKVAEHCCNCGGGTKLKRSCCAGLAPAKVARPAKDPYYAKSHTMMVCKRTSSSGAGLSSSFQETAVHCGARGPCQ